MRNALLVRPWTTFFRPKWNWIKAATYRPYLAREWSLETSLSRKIPLTFHKTTRPSLPQEAKPSSPRLTAIYWRITVIIKDRHLIPNLILHWFKVSRRGHRWGPEFRSQINQYLDKKLNLSKPITLKSSNF